jgi:hypothetical protein
MKPLWPFGSVDPAVIEALWPYVVVIVIGFLPTEIWRIMGVVVARGLDERSALIGWVRAVAVALVASVVAKLVLAPTGALAAIPLSGRLAAVGVGLVVLFALGRRVTPALAAGMLTLILAGLAVR